MSFVLRRQVGEDEDLGGTVEALRVFAEIAELDPNDEYPQLHYLVHTNEEPMPEDYVIDIARQASSLMEQHDVRLSDHARWLLGQLAEIQGVLKRERRDSNPRPPA